MMKKLLIFTFILNCFSCFGKIDTTSFNYQSIKWFIHKEDSVDELYQSNSNRFLVYVLNVYEADVVGNELCFTMSYIMNADEYRGMNATHYFDIGKDVIVVKSKSKLGLGQINLKGIKLKEIKKDDLIRIAQKLYPTAAGSFTYHPPAMISCDIDGKHERTYYENADEIPFDKSIYTSFPKGVEVELIEKGK